MLNSRGYKHKYVVWDDFIWVSYLDSNFAFKSVQVNFQVKTHIAKQTKNSKNGQAKTCLNLWSINIEWSFSPFMFVDC